MDKEKFHDLIMKSGGYTDPVEWREKRMNSKEEQIKIIDEMIDKVEPYYKVYMSLIRLKESVLTVDKNMQTIKEQLEINE